METKRNKTIQHKSPKLDSTNRNARPVTGKSDKKSGKKAKRSFYDRIKDVNPQLTYKERERYAWIREAIKEMRYGESLTEACKLSGANPEQVKRTGLIFKNAGRWYPQNEDNLSRPMHMFERDIGYLLFWVRGSRRSSLIGQYMSHVGYALEDKNENILNKYRGKGVIDTNGKVHSFETRLPLLEEYADKIEDGELEYEVSGV